MTDMVITVGGTVYAIPPMTMRTYLSYLELAERVKITDGSLPSIVTRFSIEAMSLLLVTVNPMCTSEWLLDNLRPNEMQGLAQAIASVFAANGMESRPLAPSQPATPGDPTLSEVSSAGPAGSPATSSTG